MAPEQINCPRSIGGQMLITQPPVCAARVVGSWPARSTAHTLTPATKQCASSHGMHIFSYRQAGAFKNAKKVADGTVSHPRHRHGHVRRVPQHRPQLATLLDHVTAHQPFLVLQLTSVPLSSARRLLGLPSSSPQATELRHQLLPKAPARVTTAGSPSWIPMTFLWKFCA